MAYGTGSRSQVNLFWVLKKIHGGDRKYEHLHFVPLYRETTVPLEFMPDTCVVPEGKKKQPVEPEAGSVAYPGRACGSGLSQDRGSKRGPAQRSKQNLAEAEGQTCVDTKIV